MKSSRRKRLSIIAFTVLLLIVPSSLYYLFFVQSQNGYYTKRNLRVLANIGSQVTTKIDNLATSLINVVKNAEQEKKEMVSPTENPEAKIERQGEKKVENKPQAAARTPKKPMDDKIKRSVELIDQAGISLKYEPNFSVQQWQASERTKGAPSQSRPQATNSNTSTGNSNSRPPAPTANSNSTITPQAPAARPPQAARNNSRSQSTGASPASLGTARDDPEPTVALTVKGEEGSFLLNLLYRNAATGAKGDRLFKSDLAKLVDPLVAHHVVDEMNDTRNRLFDQVLVAEQENGRVIFERGQSGLTVVSLDSLQNEKGGKLELNLANPASSLIDVQLAGEDYKLFLQPIRLTLSSSGDANSEGVRWVVCGLTRSSHFREQSFAVSYTLLIVFVFMALLAVLSWPLLKLKLMGPKDRLRRSDFALTAFSALMGTALLTFLVADLYTYISLGNTFDDQLKKLSVEIRSNFQQELGSVLAQLWRSEKRMNKLASKESSGALADLYASKHEPKLNPKEWPTKKAQEYSSTANLLAGTLDWETAQYPYFNSVTWVDGDGQQRIKWTTRDETTAFVKVKDRSYFLNARDKNLWKLRHAGRDFEYTFELVNSKNTSQNVAIVAMRVPNSQWVSSIDTTLSSLMGTVLPTGHGYAVINDAGEVLFHSDEVNNLEEQFFEECDNDRTLRAAVLARANKFINAQYLGKGHRLFVSPVAGTPWMLVVFRDKQIARTINLELLTLSLVLYLIFAVFALLLISVVYLPRRGERIRRLWPHKRNAKQYELLITVNTVLLVVFLLVARLVTNETVLVICCFLVPTLTTVLGALILKDGRIGESAAVSAIRGRLRFLTRLPYRKAYAIALVGSLALMSVLPAWGFFQIARNFELTLLVKHGQVSIARARERRAQRIASHFALIKVGPQDEQKAALLARRLDPESPKSNWDIYDSFFFNTLHSGPALDRLRYVPEEPGRLNSVLTRLRPLYDQSCVESQELARGASADGLWSWMRDGEGKLRLEKTKDGRPGETSLALASSIPAIPVPDTIPKWLGAILILAGMCCVIYLLVRFVGRHFFFLDQDEPRGLRAGEAHLSPTNNVAVLRPPVPIAVNGWCSEKSHRIDLTEVSAWPGWANRIKSNGSVTEPTVVFDHFEHDMNDPAANREKLQAIERFLNERKRVVVVSTVDPLRFSISAGEAGSSNGSSKPSPTETDQKADKKKSGGQKKTSSSEVDQTAARWAMAFSTFVTVYSRDNAEKAFVDHNTGFLEVMKASRPVWRYLETIGNEIARDRTDHEEKDLNRADIKGPVSAAGNGDENNTGFLGRLKAGGPRSFLTIRKQIAGDGTARKVKRLDRAAIEEQIREVCDQARAYHQALWATCSQDERCTLIHLALDGMISSKNPELRQLMKRGLVVRDPGLRLMDESFRRFVISSSPEEDIDAWRQGGGSNWELIKAPLLMILLSVAVFLFFTQKEVYDSSISFVSALTAGLAALFKLLGMFQKKSEGAVDA